MGGAIQLSPLQKGSGPGKITHAEGGGGGGRGEGITCFEAVLS